MKSDFTNSFLAKEVGQLVNPNKKGLFSKFHLLQKKLIFHQSVHHQSLKHLTPTLAMVT